MPLVHRRIHPISSVIDGLSLDDLPLARPVSVAASQPRYLGTEAKLGGEDEPRTDLGHWQQRPSVGRREPTKTLDIAELDLAGRLQPD
jgi:hypothetical protein